jgi:hypothetical protein
MLLIKLVSFFVILIIITFKFSALSRKEVMNCAKPKSIRRKSVVN